MLSLRRNSGNLAEHGALDGSSRTRPDVIQPEEAVQAKRSFADVVSSFFKNLWAHRFLLGAGTVSVGVGLVTIFVDIVGMGFLAPYLAPLTVGSFSVGGACIILAILMAFYAAITNAVTLHTSFEKTQFVLDMLNRKEFQFSEIDAIFDLLVERYPCSTAPTGPLDTDF